MSFMNRAWKMKQAEGEAGDVLDDEVDPHRQAESRGDRGGGDDAGGVAGDAVDGGADALLPQRPDELLVLAGRGSLSVRT